MDVEATGGLVDSTDGAGTGSVAPSVETGGCVLTGMAMGDPTLPPVGFGEGVPVEGVAESVPGLAGVPVGLGAGVPVAGAVVVVGTGMPRPSSPEGGLVGGAATGAVVEGVPGFIGIPMPTPPLVGAGADPVTA